MAMAQQGAMGPLEWLLLVALSIIWGATFFFVELALAGFTPVTLVAVRVFLAAAALHVFILATGRRMPMEGRLWAALIVMALFNNVVPFNLIIWGQTQINGSLASIINATTPIWGVLLAHFFTRDERMTPGRAMGVLLGFAGVAVMAGHDALEGLSLNLLAQIAIVGASLSYAVSGIYAKRMKGVPPLHIATGQLTVSAIVMVPAAAIMDAPWTLPAPSALAVSATIALALVSTAFAYLLYFRILAAAGATNVLLVTFLIPVSALLLGMGLLGEVLEGRHFAGMALIALGLAAIDGRTWRFLRLPGSRRPKPGSA